MGEAGIGGWLISALKPVVSIFFIEKGALRSLDFSTLPFSFNASKLGQSHQKERVR
jgi:hypothetical protein